MLMWELITRGYKCFEDGVAEKATFLGNTNLSNSHYSAPPRGCAGEAAHHGRKSIFVKMVSVVLHFGNKTALFHLVDT